MPRETIRRKFLDILLVYVILLGNWSALGREIMRTFFRHLESIALLIGSGYCSYLQVKYPNLPHNGNWLLLLLMVLGFVLAAWRFQQKRIK